MRKEHLMAALVTLVTLVAGLAAIRWFAPSLLGLSADLQLVGTAKTAPAFYANIFQRSEAPGGDGSLLNDPEVIVRAPNLLPASASFGPNDILGFRNYRVPSAAEVVAIGDSQTYGNNALIDDNWPSQMRSALRPLEVEVYNISTGGWGAAQYLKVFEYALRLRPRLIVVAFYTGNDPLESFRVAYGSELYADLRPEKHLSSRDLPRVELSPGDVWKVHFRDGQSTAFSARLRLASNAAEGAAAQAGYAIMAEAARRMSRMAAGSGIKLAFTIVPTKELALSAKLAGDKIVAPADYTKLVRDERANIARLRTSIESLPGAIYVDVMGPMQEAALRGVVLYPEDANGHPVAEGYRVIGAEIARNCRPYLNRPQGLFAVEAGEGGSFRIFLFNRDGVWNVPSPKVLEKNGWPAQRIPNLPADAIRLTEYVRGSMGVDPARFGPGSLSGADQAR